MCNCLSVTSSEGSQGCLKYISASSPQTTCLRKISLSLLADQLANPGNGSLMVHCLAVFLNPGTECRQVPNAAMGILASQCSQAPEITIATRSQSWLFTKPGTPPRNVSLLTCAARESEPQRDILSTTLAIQRPYLTEAEPMVCICCTSKKSACIRASHSVFQRSLES